MSGIGFAQRVAPARRVWRVIGWLAFNRIRVIGAEKVPCAGPTLFVATHRNGALDAAPYAMAAPGAIPVVSAQLHRTPLGRLLFRGIAVARAKDKARGIDANNRAAMERCVELLKRNRQLFIMPEGTSSLGPSHLPFQRGAARIAKRAIDAGVVLDIVPMGVHYEDPTKWQSRVEVLVGNPLRPRSGDEAELHDLITRSLEEVGAYFADNETQRSAEKLACARTLAGEGSYAQALKSVEKGIPPRLGVAARELDAISRRSRLRQWQGLPLMPDAPLPVHVIQWFLVLPAVFLFCFLNAPVLATGHLASRKLADAQNVIAFWRLAIGLPAGLIWITALSAVLFVLAQPTAAMLYWAVSAAGMMVWHRFRRLSVALHNGLFHASAAPFVVHAHRTLLTCSHHDHAA